MSTSQVRYNGNRVDTVPIQFDPRHQFVIILPNEDANHTIIKLTLWGIADGIIIRNPRDEELDTLPVYKTTSSLFWDPTRNPHAENEVVVNQGEVIINRKQLVMGTEDQNEVDNQNVNLSSIWSDSIDNILMPMLRQYDSSVSLSDTDNALSDK